MTTNSDDPREAPDLLEAALGEGLSYAKAAELAGCDKSTAYRRMRDPAFRARVTAARQAHAEEAAARVEGLATRATDELETLITDESALIRLKAVSWVLDRAEQRRQAREANDRLARLERSVEALLEQRGLRSAA